MFVKEITVMNFENYFPLLKYSTEKTNFRQFNHTECKKRNDHSQWKTGLYWVITD